MKYERIPIHPSFTDYYDIYEKAVKFAADGDIFVEIGSYIGKSAVMLCEIAEMYEKKIDFYTCDIFKVGVRWNAKTKEWDWVENANDGSTLKVLRDNLEDAGYADKVKVNVCDSVKFADNFLNKSVFFCFIDGGHDYEQVLADMRAWYPKIMNGGILAGHDYTHNPKLPWLHGVKRAVKDFCNEMNLEYTVSKNSWYISNIFN